MTPTPIEKAKQYLNEKSLDALLVTTGDPHASEYPPPHWEFRKYLTPFTGSAGTLLITKEAAYLWTDSRYWIQAEKELKDSGVNLMRVGKKETPLLADFIQENLPSQGVVALDFSLATNAFVEKLQKDLQEKGIHLKDNTDFIDTLWQTRPALSPNPVFSFTVAQKPRQKKLAELRAALKKKGREATLISALDDIAWLLNLRGSDIDAVPVFIAYLWVSLENTVLFIDKEKIPTPLIDALVKDGVSLAPYGSVDSFLKQNARQNIWIDLERTNARVAFLLKEKAQNIKADILPVTLEKAHKSEEEIDALKDTMRKDGVALVEFFAWLSEELGKGVRLTEYEAAQQLLAFRKKDKTFLGPSFETICAFAGNGALPHYATTKEGAALIEGDNLLLIDSGGQYLGGTTDITRTLAIGTPDDTMKRDYTAVLRGHIALTTHEFPEGTYASSLDAFARAPLWEIGADYGHSTGHGVGFTLSVHEMPTSISPRTETTDANRIDKGFVLSNEPGLYRDGSHGIRIENLITPVQGKNKGFLRFETLTLCPIDTRLILTSMLNAEEINWVNTYHQWCYHQLVDFVTEKGKTWLKKACEPI